MVKAGILATLTAAVALAGGTASAQQQPPPMQSDMPAPIAVPDYREPLRELVMALSDYAKARAPNFLVLSREGIALAYKDERQVRMEELARDPKAPERVTEPEGTPNRRYVRVLDGIIMDDQWCGERPTASPAFLDMLKGTGVNMLVVDHCGSTEAAGDAYKAARKAGVIPHVDSGTGPLDRVPKGVWGENPDNVPSLSGARNLLLIDDTMRYGSKDAWVMALQDSNADILAIPSFWRDREPLTAAEVHSLKFKKLGARRLVLARMDATHGRDTAYYWKRSWKVGDPAWLMQPVLSKPGTFDVQYWDPAWREIVGRTFAGLVDLGYDGVVIEGLDVHKAREVAFPLD